MRFPWQIAFGGRKKELQEEIESHLRMAVADRVARGEPGDVARQAAMREFGNAPLVQEVTRETWGWMWLERVGQDLRYALRQMRRSPGFAATVIGTLGLGIGAAAAMFTVVDHVLLEPVPYKDSGRLVMIREGEMGMAHWLDIQQWMAQNHSFQALAFSTQALAFHRSYLEGKTASLAIDREGVSPNLFRVLGVKPALGRDFIGDEPAFGPGKNGGTVILSDAVWKEAFGGDRNILGRRIEINSDSYTVVGVMPPGFRHPAENARNGQVWTAVQLGATDHIRGHNATAYQVLGRLRKEATVESARADMAIVQKRVINEYTGVPSFEIPQGIKVERYDDFLVGADVRKALFALLAAAGLLWLIASLNVSNLFLARSTVRQREIAIRGALGASNGRVMQQMAIESLVMSGAAALLGVGLALGSVKLLGHEMTLHLPLPAPATADHLTLVVLLGLTILSALMAAIWPTLLALRAPILSALKQGGVQTGMARRHFWMRGSLVAVQVALSLTLLFSCCLLLRTIYILRHVPLGFRTDHIIVANLNIPSFRFGQKNISQALYEPLLERVQSLHGIEAAGLMTEVPLGKTYPVHLQMQMNGYAIVAFMKAVSPDIQRVFGFRMAAGRFFNAGDTINAEPVVVVNRAFARLYAPDRHDPASILGTPLLDLKETKVDPTHPDGWVKARIIGILDNERQLTVADPSQPELEIPIPQVSPETIFYEGMDDVAMDLAVRTNRPEQEIVPEIRTALKQASPELANATITTMDQIVEDSYGSQRLAAHLLEIFGGSALLLCVAGLYGLLAYVVTQRTHELGVRMALGAPRGSLLWLVMRQAGAMLVSGTVIGLGLALGSGRVVRSYLYGVSAHDGWTLGLVALTLVVIGLLAAYLPARRAARVDPIEALRAE